jgi:hypothetical protein
MYKIRLDLDRQGVREVRLITTNDKKTEPYEFFLRVKPAIERFRKNLERVLASGSQEEK